MHFYKVPQVNSPELSLLGGAVLLSTGTSMALCFRAQPASHLPEQLCQREIPLIFEALIIPELKHCGKHLTALVESVAGSPTGVPKAWCVSLHFLVRNIS